MSIPPIRVHGVEIRATPSPGEPWDGRAFQAAVRTAITQIGKTLVGKILLDWIERGPNVHVEPHPSRDPHFAETLATNPPDGHRLGAPVHQFTGIPNARGTGRPSRARILFTPAHFYRYSPHSPHRERRAGTHVDEVMLHELVHALRCQHGLLDGTPMGGTLQGYDYFEEYCAYVVENMYESELRRWLAGSHRAGVVLEHLTWPWADTTSHPEVELEREQVRLFATQMPLFTSELRDIAPAVCPYNPFRWMEATPVWLPVRRTAQ